jgi:hypothetical protein
VFKSTYACFRAGSTPEIGAPAYPKQSKFISSPSDRLFHMAVVVEMQNTGDPAVRTEVVAMIEHMLAERAGDWHVSIVGSQANNRWEMKVTGPNAFERSYILEGEAGEHRAAVIRGILAKMLPAK